ncbi:isoprenyl transferase [Clostridia bacterium]|nr:isoprenyl transferase [Clostridia bacterium]
MRKLEEMDLNSLPRHIGIIMDGNGRWAKKQGLPRTMGHREGMKRLKEIVKFSAAWGIEIVSVYAFSTENWKRPHTEVNFLMKLMIEVMQKELQELHEAGVKVNILGELGPLPEETQKAIKKGLLLTKDNKKMVLNIAFNYGGRQEILRAVKNIVTEDVPVDKITEEKLSSLMYTKNMPDLDLVIRTSGEMRISNFMLWQIAYAELYVTDVFWPEFGEEEYRKAMIAYQHRGRRFGGI